MNNVLNILPFESMKKNSKVIDSDGNKGVIVECDDPHNVLVKFRGGSGLYCVVQGCSEYEPLYVV